MKITILTTGSRGDVQPFIALAKGLIKEGYIVLLAAPLNFKHFVIENKLDFYPLGVDLEKLLNEPEAKAIIDSGKILKQINWLHQHIDKLFSKSCKDAWEACQGTDLIIYKNSVAVAFSIAQKLNVPCIEVGFFPFTPTGVFPSALQNNQKNQQGIFSYFSKRLSSEIRIHIIKWQLMRKLVNNFRKSVLNEKPFPFFGPTKQFNQHKTSIIYAYSSILLPKPKDWGSNTHVTGYWFLNSDTDWIAPKELSDFIDNGEKPICFGFGSMTQEDPDYFLEMIIESLRITKQRGILLGGWSGMGYEKKLPDNIMSLHSVPHDWLFPKVAAVVHHGGAGTSAAALRAGVPSIIIPHLGDQPFWASRLFEARYATKPLLKKDLSITELVDRIQDVVNNSKMSEQAKNMQKSICSENGIENAIHIIKKILSSDN